MIVSRVGQEGENARPKGNHPSNQKNMGGHGNDQRQGCIFALMSGDARNNEVVVADNIQICFLPTYVLFDTGSSHIFVFT